MTTITSGTQFQLFPELRPDEYEALKADIAEHGILVPAEVDQDGQVLDGHHRIRIASELGIDCPTVQRAFANDDERIAHIIALNLRRRHLDTVSWAEMFERYAKVKGVKLGQGARNDKATSETVSEVLRQLGEKITPRQAQNRRASLKLPKGLKEAVRDGKKTVATAKREAKRTERITSEPGPLPAGIFRTIVVDPPWDYGDHAVRGAAATHYGVMSLEAIAALPVGSMAGEEAHLYVWVTPPQLPFVWPIIEAWGFDYKTLLTWVKPQMGTGFYFRGATEHVAFCTRKNAPLRAQNLVNWFEADRRSHSEKPEEFYQLVEAASHGPYLELFARKQRKGWEVWGDEV